MKDFCFFFIIILLSSCNKDNPIVPEILIDEYRIQWIQIDMDTINGMEKNYQLVELLIPKDRSKDTLWNQIKVYNNGELNKKYSKFYDIEVEPTTREYIYLAKIKMYSEYSKLHVDNNNQRSVDISFLNYYQDSLWFEYKRFDNTDCFEFEFTNYHNDRFTGNISEYVYRDTVVNNETLVNARITKIALSNKAKFSGIFINNDSIFKRQKISLNNFKGVK